MIEELHGVPEEREERVNAAILRYLDTRAAGQTSEPGPFLDAYPDLRDELAGFLKAQQAIDAFLEGSSAGMPELSFVPAGSLNFEIEEQIGKGGMGIVFKAWHKGFERHVAVKVLRQKVGYSEKNRARFTRERKVLYDLVHVNIVRVLDAGEADGRLYLVMELLDGQSLAEHVERRAPLPVAEACELARQAALGLQFAHDGDLTHRDIKPSNLFRTSTGQVKVLDLGLVRCDAEHDDDPLTAPGTIMGTPGYMAPEQVADPSSAGPAADIFSLGCVLYFLLAGKGPFPGNTKAERLAALKRLSPEPLARLRPDCPKEVVKMVATMMAKKPAARKMSAGQVAEKLAPFCTPEKQGGDSTAIPSRPWKLKVMLSAAVLFMALWLIAGQVFTVPQGTLVLNFPNGMPRDPAVLVNGSRVTLKGLDAAKGEVTVDVGDVTLEVRDGEAVYKNKDKVAIERGKVTVVEVALDRSPPSRPDQSGSKAVLGDGPDRPVSMPGHRVGTNAASCESLTFTPDGLHAVSESAGWAYLWDLQKRSLAKEWLVSNNGSIRPGLVAVSPNGTLLAVAVVPAFGSRRHIALFDGTTLAPVGKLTCDQMFNAFVFSSDSTLLATSESGGLGGNRVRISDVKSGKVRNEFPCGASPVISLAFSPNGKFVVAGGGEKTVRLWSLEKDRQEGEFNGHAGPVDQVAFAAAGKQILSASAADGTIRIWDAATQKEVKQISTQKAGRMVCSTFWGGKRCLTAHANGLIVLWDLEKGEELARFENKNSQVKALAISPDGFHALTALSMDHVVSLMRLPPPPVDIDLSKGIIDINRQGKQK